MGVMIMNVYLNEVTGLADALTSMYMSKRTWTRELEEEIRRDCKVIDIFNKCKYPSSEPFSALAEYESAEERVKKRLESFCKFAWKHITMLDFITLSVTVEGLHRAGQDDWDAHAYRFNNRIIRSSTRLADFGEDEMSDFYKDKIIPTETALAILGIETPQTIEKDGQTFVLVDGGYVREDLKNNRDAKRGLYRMCIPSNFIFKINLAQWAHVYKMRNKNGSANPEVKEVAERIQDQVEQVLPWFDRDFIKKVEI